MQTNNYNVKIVQALICKVLEEYRYQNNSVLGNRGIMWSSSEKGSPLSVIIKDEQGFTRQKMEEHLQQKSKSQRCEGVERIRE